MKEYKASKAFLEELVESSMEAYQFGFAECKSNVAQAFPELEPSNIVDVEPKEGEGEAVEETSKRVTKTKAKPVGLEEVTTKGHAAKVTAGVKEFVTKAFVGAPGPSLQRIDNRF